ncbi:MAG: hypothetical protein CVV04_11560 [Firmicutes bacterium HGW-Firmicutes-9]|jgi:uncharacterized membrane protein|nr:MAG: hypothetical protein CVV04_11560 [Firmicutes bacterium HGW-Firmicutes-9]
MEKNSFDRATFRKIEGFRIATGVLAIIAALWLISRFVQYIKITDDFAYQMGTFYLLIGKLNVIFSFIALVLFAIFVLFLYGRTDNTLGAISILVMSFVSASSIMLIIIRIIKYAATSNGLELFLSIITGIIFPLVSSIILLLIALTWLKKISISVKFLPIVLIGISFFSYFLTSIVLGFFEVQLVRFYLLDSLFLFALLMFTVFCPLTYRKVKANVQSSFSKQQEILSDLDSQLLLLKNEFDRGNISPKEYESRRKLLIDKL